MNTGERIAADPCSLAATLGRFRFKYQFLHTFQTERFLILFEKTSFADNDWRFSEWGKLPVCPQVPLSALQDPKDAILFRNSK
jgi:hypothetical protein